MTGSRPPLPPEVQSWLQQGDGEAPKPTFLERVANWDTVTESALRIWSRACIGITAGLGVYIFGMLIWYPDGIKAITELIKLIISSGRGFTVPAILLAVYAVKLLDRFLIQRGFSKVE